MSFTDFFRIQISVLSQFELLACSCECSRCPVLGTICHQSQWATSARRSGPAVRASNPTGKFLGSRLWLSLIYCFRESSLIKAVCCGGFNDLSANVVKFSDAGKPGTANRTTTMSTNSRSTRTPRRGANDKWDEKKLMTSSKSELVKLDLVVSLFYSGTWGSCFSAADPTWKQ